MVQIISEPRIIPAAGFPPKNITEFIGRTVSGTEEVSIARMKSPPGWAEPGQIPEFDEYTIVLSGTLVITTETDNYRISAGQAVFAPASEWVRYSSPEGADYLAICLPAFSHDLVHRDTGPDWASPEKTSESQEIIYKENGREGFLCIEDLWHQLREHHASHARIFADVIRARSFSERCDEILASNICGDILIQTAYSESLENPVGFCISSVKQGNIGEIESVYVEPAYRSRGIGSVFIRRACQWMKEQDAREIVIGVCEGNEKTFEFYQRFGFYLRKHNLLKNSKPVG